MPEPTFVGVHHVAVNVRDVERSMQHHHPDAEDEFSERRTGLDHLALGVGSREDLDAWVSRLDAAGVSHSGVKITPATGSALVAFRDPDNIQLELYVAQGATAR